MATVHKVVRVANPRRYRSTGGRFVKRKSNRRVGAKRKRRVSRTKAKAPVIRRYSVKTLKKELKRRGVKTSARKRNPAGVGRRYKRSKNPRRKVRKQNPVLIELGAVNPRRRANVAKRRRRSNTTRRNPRRRRHVMAVARVRRRRVTRRRARRRNPVVAVIRRRRVNRRRHVRRYARRRRNPAVFGHSGGKDLLMMIGGGLVGVAATKFLPTLVPASLTSGFGPSPIVSVLLTGAGAFVAGFLAKKFLGGTFGGAFGDAVLFGGLMQAGSVALSAFAPPSIARQLALSGLGDIVPGYFPVPQNPVTSRQVIPMPAPLPSGVGAFRRAFGGQR